MKFRIPLIFVTSLYLSSSAGNIPDPSDVTSESYINDEPKKISSRKQQWIEVPLDHFNLFDNRTWKMRYFINDEFFQEGMPLFIEIGGEWTVARRHITQGQLHSLAETHNGFLLATEHRYYGKSLPFSKDFTTENLRYLQIEQALEDLAYVIEHLKSSIAGLQNSTVVVHGCSYAGMLATWLRLRFPHVVDIGYASSAPLGVGLDYPEYYEVVNDVYANVSVSCIETIKQGFHEMIDLIETEDGYEIVMDALKDWNCVGDVYQMHPYSILGEIIGILNVQSDPVEYEDVGCLVLSMDTDELTNFQRLANFVVLKSKDRRSCGKTQPSQEQLCKDDAWRYQTCTEVGLFQTLSSDNSRHPFQINKTLASSVEACVEKFGHGVTEQLIRTGIERVTRRYGGKHPRITKLLTVHGSTDPWRVLGKSEDTDPEAPVIILRGSHCVDNTLREDDPPKLIKEREIIRDVISKWINQM